MSKNKIIWDSPEPSSKEIQAKKDYENLQRRFKGSGPVKNFKYWTLAAVAIAIIGIGSLVFFYDSEENSAAESLSEEVLSDPLNSEDIPNILPEIPSEIYSISAVEPTQILTPGGGIISIPENAFTTLQGEPCKGAVNIQLTTFNDPLDIYMSGISMTYDSSGVEYPFQSGGMFELKADNGTEELQLAQGKELVVYHPSTLDQPKMNQYFMEDRNADWEYEGPSEILTFEEACKEETIRFERDKSPEYLEIQEMAQDINHLKEQKESLKETEISEPHQFNKLNYTFDLDIDPKEFPELASFENVQFEVVDRNFRHHHFDRVWDDIRLKKLTNGFYQIDLYEENEISTFKIHPILDEKEMARALKSYEAKLDQRDSDLAKIDEEIYTLEEFLEEKKNQKHIQPEIFSRNNIINALNGIVTEGKTVRKFTLAKLGVFNCDKPYDPGENALKVDANFLVKKRALQVFAITIVNISRNVYMQLVEKDWSDLRLRKRDQHIAYGRNRDGKLVILRKQDFDVLNKDVLRHDFDMTLVDADYSDYKAIRAEVDALLASD